MLKKFNNYIDNSIKSFDKQYLEMALKAAEHARSQGNEAYGAVLVFPGRGTLVEYDTTFTQRDVTAHAEMNLVRKASKMFLRKLDDAILYTSSEPCLMCLDAIHKLGIKEIVCGSDKQKGFTNVPSILEHYSDIKYRLLTE